MSTTQSDSLIGMILGARYEIVSRISRGGTAVVYRGIDRRLGRTVAIKVIHSDLASDPDYVKRFDREARAAAILSHPNIVAVFDQGRANERPYIVMEFIRGQSLRAIISSSAPLPAPIGMAYAHEVAKALGAAHESGLIHRDIKPENVLITNDGQVKVTDFGLAKTILAPTSTASQGVLMGTMSYIAPEIPQNGSASPASDIYSTGVVMYEMLTGKKPHTGDDLSQVLYKHVHEDIPPPSKALPNAARSRIPDYVDALVTACTSRNPESRPANGRILETKITKVRRSLEAGLTHDGHLVREFADGAPEETTPLAPLLYVPTTSSSKIPVEDTPVDRDPPPPVVKLARVGSAPNRRSGASKRRRSKRVAIAVTILALIAAVGFGTWGWWLAEGRWTTVPQLTSETETAGRDLLEAGSLLMVTEEEYSESIDAGAITRTVPKFGTRLKKGDTVTVYISKGPERYAMPKVVGMYQEQARSAIENANLTVGEVEKVWDETIEATKVISASEKAGAFLKPHTKVDLVVSKGRQPIAVVSYVGKTLEEAKKGIQKAGLKYTTKEDYSVKIPAGSIISQNPSSGDLYKGDQIELVVSKGPKMIKVPSVLGMSRGDAKQKLADAGFRVTESEVNPTGVTVGVAVGTDPEAGKTAPDGSTVILKII